MERRPLVPINGSQTLQATCGHRWPRCGRTSADLDFLQTIRWNCGTRPQAKDTRQVQDIRGAKGASDVTGLYNTPAIHSLRTIHPECKLTFPLVVLQDFLDLSGLVRFTRVADRASSTSAVNCEFNGATKSDRFYIDVFLSASFGIWEV